MILYAFSYAQITATGKVVDEKGASISGATVTEKGTSNATVTAKDGTYSIKVKTASKLIISSIGFEKVEIVAGTGVNTKLQQETGGLTEVVVTGVGAATSKRKTSIDVGTLATKDAAKSVLGSVEQALMGKIAGAQIQVTSGTPGTKANIVLRALNTLGSPNPLYMVDGVELSDINGIDLGNIDRVEVVKGPSGGMLYGAQGANGVIQIFTKKGFTNRKTEVSLLTQVSSGTVIRNDEKIFAKNHSFETDAQGFITGGGARIQQDANGAWDAPDFMDFTTNFNLKHNKQYKEKLYDKFSQAYNRAYTINTTLSVTGGGEKSDYSFTLSRYNEQNVMSNRLHRTSIGSNIGFELTKGLTFRNSNQMIFASDDLLSGDADASIGSTGTGRFSLFNTFPYIDFTYKNAQGYTVVSANGGDKTTKNVLSEPEWRTRISDRTRIINNANLNYKINKYLELDYKYGIEYLTLDRTNYYKNQTNAPQEATAFWGQTKSGSIRNDFSRTTNQNSLATVYIKTDLENDFNLKLPIKTLTQLSYDYRRYETRAYFAQGSELPTFPPYNIGVATTKTSGDAYSTFVTYGILFNQSFDYKNTAGISFGFRSDYSSVFGAGSLPANFNRITGYFRPTEITKIPFLSDWKLRFAYGGGGTQPDVYGNQVTLGVSQLGNQSTLFSLSAINNPNLRVQETFETEMGTDFVVKSKSKRWFTATTIGFTYWKRNTNQTIQGASLPLTSGAATISDNLTKMSAKGIDLMLDAQVYQNDKFGWDLSVRMGTQKTIIDDISNNADIVDGLFTVKKGQEVGLLSFQAPLTSITQVNSVTKIPYLSAAQQSTAEVVNGMVVDTATKRVYMTAQNDQVTVGSYIPKFTMSFTNSFNFNKRFILSFQFDWWYGHKIYNQSRQWLYRDRLSADFDKPVTINGQTGAFVSYYNSLYNSISPSTWFAEDGTYLRLRDLSLTYNIPSTVKFIKNASFTLSARNLLTITKYTGNDPEATTTANAQGDESSSKRVGAVSGVDYFSVPNLRSFQASLRVTF